jgi:hypothetical protein
VSDILDVLIPHRDEVFSGTYYAQLPNTPSATSATFDYNTVDPTEWHYQALFSQVMVAQSTSAAIKTKADLKWRVGGYIVTQDGRFYEIISVQQDYAAASKQAFRYLSVVSGVDFVIRLSEKENPWGLK